MRVIVPRILRPNKYSRPRGNKVGSGVTIVGDLLSLTLDVMFWCTDPHND